MLMVFVPFRRHVQKFLFLLVFGWCRASSENIGNLVDPCYFPTPQFANFAGLCQFHYHQVRFVCDPLAVLSRTEAEILNSRFDNYSLTGCVDCKTNARFGPFLLIVDMS